jgi:phosphorylase/glycogen(starch) synthase
VTIGPWLHGQQTQARPFEVEPGHEAFIEAAAAQGINARVGRWNIPGRPLTILIGFSKLFEKKDAILSGLWERHKVDSLFGGWDYVEPAMFGHAAGIAIELWIEHEAQPGRSVAQFHEWMTGAGILYLKDHVPHVATIFTTHATILGRALSSTGLPPAQALGSRSPEEAADQVGVRAKHSIEGAVARAADVFTTVSALTAGEVELMHRRQAQPVVPNGLDLGLLKQLSESTPTEQAREALTHLASCMCGVDLRQAMLLCISGRYEMHNKGIDVLLDALAQINAQAGPAIVCFLLVPAAQSGPRRKVRECLLGGSHDPEGISSHEIIERERDPIQRHAERLGLINKSGSRVKLIQVPVYLDGSDPLLPLQYEAALKACDLSCFPSFYEPWGYTPAESIGVGVPTITTDMAGFGVWARENNISADQGVTVLPRIGLSDEAFVRSLASAILHFQSTYKQNKQLRSAAQASANKFAWTSLIRHYEESFERALAMASERPQPAPRAMRLVSLAQSGPRIERRPRLRAFDVEARLPAALADLERLASNLWWSWDAEATQLFREISPDMWESCLHNPVLFLRRAYPRDLELCANNPDYVARLQSTVKRFDAYIANRRASVDLGQGRVLNDQAPVAYFCFEFGVHESIRIYSGGLGLLAGDHLKSASDLDLPLVGMGLFYHGGYVMQRLSPSGEQLSLEAPNLPSQLPLTLMRDDSGVPLEVEVPLSETVVHLRVWRLDVGRIKLYLLDSDFEPNTPVGRSLTRRLYSGDNEHRLRQEIVLGRGGMRMLDRLGIHPAVLHLNEGHAAFAVLERVSILMRRENLKFEEAALLARASSVFTTHTPVPAGHDRFDENLVRRFFADTEGWVGLPWARFMALGQDHEQKPEFNMTFLACSLAGFVNGVAKKHGEVSRDLLHSYWPGLLINEVPVDHVTNGVHLPTWTRPGLQRLLGVEKRLITGEDFEQKAHKIDRAELWKERQAAKRDLLHRCRSLLERSAQQRQDSPRTLVRMLEGLRDDALVVGFARRFAPYKRATLLFKDPERLARLLSNADRPVLFLFSGKAHPADGGGKDLLRQVVEISRSERFVGKVLFLEDYDIGLARYLKQGVDVWLNNPIRPLEASGTSGMKCSANGALNLSILDGWWIEACDGQNGWAIGNLEKTFPNQELQDQLDNEHLLRLLEEDVVPLYFERDAHGLPQGWLDRVIHNLATIPKFFDTNRMVSEYAEKAYKPLASAHFTLAERDYARTLEVAKRRTRVIPAFNGVVVKDVRVPDLTKARSGDELMVEADIDLNGLDPSEVCVELVLGHANGNGWNIAGLDLQRLQPALPAAGASPGSNGSTSPAQPVPPGQPITFTGKRRIQASGAYRFGLRVRPRRDGPWDQDLIDRTIWG